MKIWILGILVTLIGTGPTLVQFHRSLARENLPDQSTQKTARTPIDAEIASTSNVVVLPNEAEEYEAIAIAKYLKSEVVKRTDFVELVKRTNDLSKAIGGRVFIFEVRNVICRERLANRNDIGFARETVAFYRKEGSGVRQHFEVGRHYLLFLSELPNQKELKKVVELEDKTKYFDPDPFDGEKRKRLRIRELANNLSEDYVEQLKIDFCKGKEIVTEVPSSDGRISK